MGLVPDNRLFSSMLQEVVIPLRKGDRFLAYTDGLTEATSPAKKPYGTDRLAKVLSECRGTGPEKIIESIMKDIAAHTGDEPHHDDLTMVAIEIA
jgi:sigma-B regulation protein RsbU (phosphoserine phosphatase)